MFTQKAFMCPSFSGLFSYYCTHWSLHSLSGEKVKQWSLTSRLLDKSTERRFVIDKTIKSDCKFHWRSMEKSVFSTFFCSLRFEWMIECLCSLSSVFLVSHWFILLNRIVAQLLLLKSVALAVILKYFMSAKTVTTVKVLSQLDLQHRSSIVLLLTISSLFVIILFYKPCKVGLLHTSFRKVLRYICLNFMLKGSFLQ